MDHASQATARPVIESNRRLSVIQFPISAWARLNALFSAARSAVCLSRILLFIIAVEVLTMPITQGIWAWDKFLRGGQDFELGLLIILTCLCFVLLRVQENKGCFEGLVITWAPLRAARKFAAATLLICRKPLEHRCRIPSHLTPIAFPLPLLT